MNPLYVRTQRVHGVRRVSLPIENQIGDVGSEPTLSNPTSPDGADQRDGCLLSGLAIEVLAVVPAVGGAFPNGFDRFFIRPAR